MCVVLYLINQNPWELHHVKTFYCIKVKVLITQLCLTLWDPMHCSLPGSSVHGIVQARILEWVAMPPPGDLPDQGINPGCPALQAGSLPSEPQGKPISLYAAATAKSLQSYPTLCNCMSAFKTHNASGRVVLLMHFSPGGMCFLILK